MNKLILVILTIFFSEFVVSQNYKKQIENNKFIEIKDDKFGIIDSLNNIIVPFIYDFIEYKNSRLIVKIENLNGVLTTKNELLIPIKYQFILPRKNDRFIIWTKKNIFGLTDLNGNIIIPLKYKNISATENDDYYITENENNLNGVFDFNGKNIIEENYRFYTIDNYKIFAMENNKPHILDIENIDNNIDLSSNIKFIETVKHYSISENLFQIIKKKGKYGVINSKNIIVIPIEYDEIRSSENWKYFIIKQRNKVGLININGTIIKKPIYDSIQLRKEYIVLGRKNKKDEIYSYE
ncbi:WG repeat-containing protein [Tenacibaculum aquimarinum]|uniref:WG repeat-containing protein n=1 Tax=Tenacibaculum aquimarinum TaxID=2910675 RepID=UPI001F0B5016|nr:WG repeat-containing protein [Tenacibaculum aquimarinum]MCH3883413.1 WG repeat-containing protein [Tenacibaculum aquimarinum]MCH3885444.1 WG repeat-containing protein [Tenacibaculum aquimarinum]